MISSKDLRKGQVSAPFEVLVAVIVMGFVILAGTYALKNLSENTCLGDKKKEMGQLTSSLRDVVLGSDLTFRNISFQTKACFDSKFERIELNQYSDQARCSAYCGGGVQCILLEYVYEDQVKQQRKYPIQPICTGIASNIKFTKVADDCGISDEDSTWILVDALNEPIEPGNYRLFRSSGTTESSINFCLLRRKI